MAYHARHESGRLQPRQPLFGHAGVQTTVGLIDRNREIHSFGHTWTSRKAAGMRLESVPALWCIAPLPGVLQPVRRALVDSNRLLLYEYSPPSQNVHSRRRMIPNAGSGGGLFPNSQGSPLAQIPRPQVSGPVEVTRKSSSGWGSWGTSGGYPSVRVRCVRISALNVFHCRLFA
jgi:hypothetical protein